MFFCKSFSLFNFIYVKFLHRQGVTHKKLISFGIEFLNSGGGDTLKPSIKIAKDEKKQVKQPQKKMSRQPFEKKSFTDVFIHPLHNFYQAYFSSVKSIIPEK